MTDPTPDSLRLSWTVPEGHFDSFVVQFKDRDGPRVVPAEGHERSVTIGPLDASRKYRFLLYGLLGKRRHGPLTAEGTTGEGSPCGRASLIWRLPRGRSLWSVVVAAITTVVWLQLFWLGSGAPSPCTSPEIQPCRMQPWYSPAYRSLSPSLQRHPAFQKQRDHFLSVFPSQRPGELWTRLEQNHVWGRSCR